LPKGYVWGVQWAERENKKGRAKGRMIMGIRKKMVEKGKGVEVIREGIVMGKVKMGKQKWRIIGVYVNGNMEEMLREIEEWIEEKEEGVYTIEGDFKARTGGEGGEIETEGEGKGGEKKVKGEKSQYKG